MTQEALAERAGLSARGLSDLERGLRLTPHHETVRRLAEALGLQGAATATSSVLTAAPGRWDERWPNVPAPAFSPRHNLPRALNSFVGRRAETAALEGVLATKRLITLIGVGGGGKTRLALHVAERVAPSFSGGVWFVDLAALTDTRLVPAALATTLGLREQAHRPLEETLRAHLRPRQALVVLDNCEHLADACGDLAAALLQACPGLTVMATSRQPLRITGEVLWLVPPLATPPPTGEVCLEGELLARLADYDAISLFVERARACLPHFGLTSDNAAAVVGICRRLEGLPLAIELASARLPALTPKAMLERMDLCLPMLTGGPRDAPTRQQTLRNTISWSYDLLDPDEQALFRRLASFRGCTLEAIEMVCAGAPAQAGATSIALPALRIDVLDTVRSLVEKSLLRREELADGQPRYAMLETVREFAQERSAESGESDAIQRRHILYYLELAETAEREVVGPRESIVHAQIEQEHDNLRTAFDGCVARGYAEPGFRMALALWWFWLTRGYLSEARECFAALFARFALRKATGKRAADRAKALHVAGTLASIQGDFAAARALQEEGVAISRALDDMVGVHAGLDGLVVITSMQGDYEAGRLYAQECLGTARAIGDKEMIGHALNTSASLLHDLGDYSGARELAEESVAVLREAGNPRQIIASQLTLGVVAHDQGDHETAWDITEIALADLRRVGHQRAEALALANLATFASSRGDFGMAFERLSESLAIQVAAADTAGIAFVLERFAGLATDETQYVQAIQLGGAAAALRQLVGAPLPPASQLKLDNKLSRARRALGDERATEARDQGCAMTLDDAIAYALVETRCLEAIHAPLS